jgi:hypothetical protein
MIPATSTARASQPPARAVTAALAATVLVMLAGFVLTGLEWGSLAISDAVSSIGARAGAIAYAALGALIVYRVGNLVGWFMLAEGAASAVMITGSAYAIFGVKAHPGTLPAFQPLRQRAARLANRLVYGERATPYQVLSDFAAGMAGQLDLGGALDRMVSLLAGAAGASRVEAWIQVGAELRPGGGQVEVREHVVLAARSAEITRAELPDSVSMACRARDRRRGAGRGILVSCIHPVRAARGALGGGGDAYRGERRQRADRRPGCAASGR